MVRVRQPAPPRYLCLDTRDLMVHVFYAVLEVIYLHLVSNYIFEFWTIIVFCMCIVYILGINCL